jgi:hypothetical protein
MRELLMTLMFSAGIFALVMQTAQCFFEFSTGGISEEEAEDEPRW